MRQKNMLLHLHLIFPIISTKFKEKDASLHDISFYNSQNNRRQNIYISK